MSKLFATLKSKLLCALALVFAACLTLGLSFSVPAHAEENLIDRYNLTLSNDLSVNFYAKEAVGENAYLTASVEGIDGEKTIYANAGNAYKFTVTDLAPQLMSRKITVKLYNVAKELKGSNEITLSDYCKMLLDRGAAGNNMGEKEFKALSTLVVDLLNYGAAAQEYKGYEATCNTFLTGEAYKDYVAGEYTMPAPSAFTATVADEGTKVNVKPTTAKLYLDYNVVAKIAFEVKDIAVDGVKALVGGSAVSATVSSATATTAGVTTYTASIPLSVLDIEKEVSVTLLSGEKEVGYKVTGSVSGYLSTRAANTEATDKTLASKLYAYAKSAAATLVTPSYTVTLAAGATGGTLTFADGKTSADVTVGEALPALAEVNNFLGFMNEDGTIYSADTFKMPSENVTLIPVINTDEYVTTGDGKLDYGRQGGGSYNAVSYSGTATDGGNAVVENEIARVFYVSSEGGTQNDSTGKNSSYRNYAPYDRVAGGTYILTLTYKNLSDTTIAFDVYPRDGSNDKSELVAIATVTLAAGEVKTVSFDFTGGKVDNNFLFYYKLTTAVSNAPLATFAKVKVVGTLDGNALPLSGKAFGQTSYGLNGSEQLQNYASIASQKDAIIENTSHGAIKAKEITLNLKNPDVKSRIQAAYGDTINVYGLTFTIVLENRSGRAVTFDIAQVNGGVTEISGAYEHNVTMQDGEVREFTFSFSDDSLIGKTNPNALTVFTFRNADTTNPVVFAMAVSYKNS